MPHTHPHNHTHLPRGRVAITLNPHNHTHLPRGRVAIKLNPNLPAGLPAAHDAASRCGSHYARQPHQPTRTRQISGASPRGPASNFLQQVVAVVVAAAVVVGAKRPLLAAIRADCTQAHTSPHACYMPPPTTSPCNALTRRPGALQARGAARGAWHQRSARGWGPRRRCCSAASAKCVTPPRPSHPPAPPAPAACSRRWCPCRCLAGGGGGVVSAGCGTHEGALIRKHSPACPHVSPASSHRRLSMARKSSSPICWRKKDMAALISSRDTCGGGGV